MCMDGTLLLWILVCFVDKIRKFMQEYQIIEYVLYIWSYMCVCVCIDAYILYNIYANEYEFSCLLKGNRSFNIQASSICLNFQHDGNKNISHSGYLLMQFTPFQYTCVQVETVTTVPYRGCPLSVSMHTHTNPIVLSFCSQSSYTSKGF